LPLSRQPASALVGCRSPEHIGLVGGVITDDAPKDSFKFRCRLSAVDIL
jgi:hypothetical protein